MAARAQEPATKTMTASIVAAAAEFEEHVELDEGVLATTAPLPVASLERIFRLIAGGLQQSPDLQQRVNELRDRLSDQRAIGAAEAVAGMLELLGQHKEADQHFKGMIVHVLKGDSLPHQSLSFGSATRPRSTPVASPAKAVASSPARAAPTTANSTPQRSPKQVATPVKSPKPTANAADVATPSPSRSRRETTRTGGPSLPSPVSPTPSPPPPRKRSIDSTYSSSSEPPAAPESKKKAAKRKMVSTTLPFAPSTTYPVKDRNDPSLHPLDAVPTLWEELHYRPVEVININAPGAKDKIEALRYASTPFVLEGYSNWMKFASEWVRPNGSLDTEAFLRGLHDVKVPVLEKNYEDTKPISSHVPLAHYVRNYWDKGKSDLYLHQWQFPLTPRAAKLLCYKCEELPVLGDNLLLYWLDAVRGDNPLQYLFMGQRQTTSRMHQDPGGLDITIAPIVGTKRVTMLHKQAAKIDSVHDQINFHKVDLDKTPLLAFCPAWRVDVHPGQLLFMPEGTFHACENLSACLSYHRLHVDHVSLPGFLASFLAQDSPSISHATILWNAVHDVIASLEENLHANGAAIDMEVATRRKLDSLRALRHAARVLSLEETLPTEDAWDWTKLLGDIDHLLAKIDPTAQGSHQKKNQNKHPAKKNQNKQVNKATVIEVDSGGEEEEEEEGKAEVVVASSSATTSAVVASALSQGNKTLSTHWDELQIKVGDTIGVQIFERRNKAHVRKVALNLELVQIHYVDWGSIYDEFLPVTALYQRSTRSSKRVAFKKAPQVHDQVLAKWGSKGELYPAIVLKVLRTNACLVHYLKFDNDWDQWVLPGHIFKNFSLASARVDEDE